MEGGRLVGLVTQDDVFHVLRRQAHQVRNGAIASS
jgi:CBS-domain-containing membrane protein